MRKIICSQRILTGLHLVMFSCMFVAQASELNVDDYVYLQKLNIEPGHSIYETRIPASLYLISNRYGTEHIRVLKNSGEPISFSVRKAEEVKQKTVDQIELPYFPVMGASSSRLDDLKLKIMRDSNQLLIDVKSEKNTGVMQQSYLAYILNLENVDKVIDEITFTWPSTQKTFVIDLIIESSDDLVSWIKINDSAVLADMHFNNNKLLKNKVKIDRRVGKYLRISWDRSRYFPALSKVMATSSNHTIHQQHNWHTLKVTKSKDKDIYRFELPGWMPVDNIELILPEDNSACQASFYSRSNEAASWTYRGSKSIYKLKLDGRSVADSIIDVTTSRDRHWKIEIPDSNLVIGNSLPTIKIGWQAEKIRFLARGSTEYLLALGQNADANSSRDYDLLLNAISGDNKTKAKPATATVGEIIRSSTVQAEVISKDEVNTKAWVLWGVLLIGVALLGFMAVHLYKQIKLSDK